MAEEQKDDGFADLDEVDSTSLVLVKHASLLQNGLGQSLSLYVPEGYGLSLLRRLVYSGCKAIGERELLKLSMECNTRVFPQDYPETEAGQLLAHSKAMDVVKNDYCPRPPSKRLNFQLMKQPAPFLPSVLFAASNVRHFTLQSVCRGVPTDNSLIYLPTVDDLRVICAEHFQKR